jgi:catechol 2,3-dioxygenase-like lactoylglutathione lyase family enzyme
MAVSCVLLYVKDLAGMTAFYRDAVGLAVVRETETWVELDGGGVGLGLHAIPAPIAEGIVIGEVREETPYKLIFVADRERLVAHGARLIERPWGGVDGVDPEGNVFGLFVA